MRIWFGEIKVFNLTYYKNRHIQTHWTTNFCQICAHLGTCLGVYMNWSKLIAVSGVKHISGIAVHFYIQINNCIFTFSSEFRQNNAFALRSDASSSRTQRVECTGQASILKCKCIIFCLNSWALTKYAVVNLIYIHNIKKLFNLLIVIDKTFLQSFKKFLNITHKIKITWKVNKSNLRTCDCTTRYSRMRVTWSECNCTKIMYACYFRIFWVFWIQIRCSMCIVYAECMNNF